MNIKDLIVTELALFSWRQGNLLIPGVCLSGWLGIAHVLNNRLRAGWWDTDWLKVIANAAKHSPTLPDQMDFTSLPDHWSREFRSHYESCEKIYDNRLVDEITASANSTPKYSSSGEVQCGVYYAVLSKVTNPWFYEKIMEHPEDHPRTAEVSGGDGNLVFFG